MSIFTRVSVCNIICNNVYDSAVTGRVISESVFWSELPGTREYAANFFFIMYSESVGTNVQKTRVIRTDPGLHGFYRGPMYDNGTSNALKSPLTTELTTLGHIF